MKTNKIILAAAFAASVVSCQKDNLSENKATEPMTISTEVLTKTSLEGSEVHWSSDDVIAVFDNTDAKNEFTVSDTNGSNASFSGSVTTGTTQIYAVYPYVHAISANSGIIKVNVPSDQTSKAGSFAEEHNISVAKAQKTPGVEEVSGVTFKNACALLKFTVPSYISDMQKVTVSSNSVIAGEMTVDYSSETPAFSISEEGSKSISMTGEYEAGSTFWFVLAPVTLDGITVNVETAKGVYSMSASAQFEMTAGQYRNLGTLELAAASANSASAAHTYSNGMLTGTEVTVRLGIPSETSGYITALNLEVKNADGVTVRTLSKDSASETETISPDQAWPYLPKGDYTVSGSYTLSGVTEKEIEAIAFSISESPVFEISEVTAHTSYSRYLAGDPSGANALDGSTIYNAGAVITVAETILNNGNYPSLSLTDNGAAAASGDLAGRTWGRHTIKATYTLDGVTAEGSTEVEVTGLPYSYNFVNGSLDKYRNDGWNTSGKLRVSNESLIGRANTLVLNHRRYSKVFVVLFNEKEKGFVVSPKFHVPADLNVQPCILSSSYNANGTITRTGYVGAVSSPTSSNTGSVRFSTTGGSDPEGTVTGSGAWMDAFTISSAAPYISIDCDDRSSSDDLGSYYFLHEANFRYAE